MSKAREDKAAEGEFLADGRHNSNHEHQRPEIGLLQHFLHLFQGRADVFADRIELRHDGLQDSWPPGADITASRAAAGIVSQAGRFSNSVCRGLLVRRSVIGNGRRGDHNELRDDGHAGQIAKTVWLRLR